MTFDQRRLVTTPISSWIIGTPEFFNNYSCSYGTLSGTVCQYPRNAYTYYYYACDSYAYGANVCTPYPCGCGGWFNGSVCVVPYCGTFSATGYNCPNGGSIVGTNCEFSATATPVAKYGRLPALGRRQPDRATYQI